MGHRSKGRKTRIGETRVEWAERLARKVNQRADRAFRKRKAAAYLLPWSKQILALEQAQDLYKIAMLRTENLLRARIQKVRVGLGISQPGITPG